MKILLPISILALACPLSAEIPTSEVTTEVTTGTVTPSEATQVAELSVPSSYENPPSESEEQQPKHVSKASKYTNKRQRSRHVLDVVLAGIVTVGTFIAIMLL